MLLTQYSLVNWRKDRKEKTERKGEALALSYFLLHPFPSSPSLLFAPVKTSWPAVSRGNRKKRHSDLLSKAYWEGSKQFFEKKIRITGASTWNTTAGLCVWMCSTIAGEAWNRLCQLSSAAEMKVWTLLVSLSQRLSVSCWFKGWNVSGDSG